MGWSITDYSGLKANGPDSNWRLGMFELCRAINERQFGSKTEFFKGDGSHGANVTYGDLFGLNSSESQCGANLYLIQSAIVSMCTRFTQTSGGDDFWTKAILEGAIGESLSESATGPLDSRYWNAQRLALDRLLYTQASGDAAFVSGTGSRSRFLFEDPSWFPNTGDEAWGDLSYYTGSRTTPGVAMSMSGPGSAFNTYYASASSSSVAHIPLLPVIPSGIVKIKYYVNIANQTKIGTAGPYEPGYHVGTATGTISWASGSYYRTVEIETSEDDLSSDGLVSISIDDGIPTTNPMPHLTGTGGAHLYNSPSFLTATLDRAKAYYDITSLLSDQT